jgi:predicted NodU family carbamoyl transferase
MIVLGINAVFQEPAAALVVDGKIVAAAEEERFSRRKHGKPCVPFSTWELPEAAARWCLNQGGITPAQLDAISYSYDPALAPPDGANLWDNEYEAMRTFYVRRAPNHLADLLPSFDRAKVRFVPHHLAHAASAYLVGPYRDCSVLVMDGRGEKMSYLAGRSRGGDFTPLARVALPHSLGLRYEELTMHLGFHRSSDEYKVMALASYGTARWKSEIARSMHATGDGGFVALPIDLTRFTPPRTAEEPLSDGHADLAASVQAALQDTLLDLARWLRAQTTDRALVMAGGVALNVVANSFIADHRPFDHVWVQPAAGDAGPPSAAQCTWRTRAATSCSRWRARRSDAAGATPNSKPGSSARISLTRVRRISPKVSRRSSHRTASRARGGSWRFAMPRFPKAPAVRNGSTSSMKSSVGAACFVMPGSARRTLGGGGAHRTRHGSPGRHHRKLRRRRPRGRDRRARRYRADAGSRGPHRSARTRRTRHERRPRISVA